jgi:hypothetical protein
VTATTAKPTTMGRTVLLSGTNRLKKIPNSMHRMVATSLRTSARLPLQIPRPTTRHNCLTVPQTHHTTPLCQRRATPPCFHATLLSRKHQMASLSYTHLGRATSSHQFSWDLSFFVH